MSNYEKMRQMYAHELDAPPQDSRFNEMNKKYNNDSNDQGSFMKGVNAINYVGDNVLAPFAGGAVQTGGDIGASLGNLGLKPINALFGTDYNIPHPELRRHFNQGGMGDAAFFGGQLAGGLVPGAGAIKGLQASRRAGGYAGLGMQAAKGAGIGYATGEDPEGERGLATALGGLTGGASALTAGGIERRIMADRARQMNRHGEVYRDIFQSAENAGIRNPNVNINAENFDRVMKRVPEKYRERISNVRNNPTIEGLHEAQSDLGRWIRKVESSAEAKTHTLPISQQRSLESAREIRRQIQDGITQSLAENGLLEESLLYPELTRSYAENVAPYFAKAIGDVAQGAAKPNKLAERLIKDEKFMMQLGRHYPELGINSALNSTMARTAMGAGAGALGIPYGIRSIKNEFDK